VLAFAFGFSLGSEKPELPDCFLGHQVGRRVISQKYFLNSNAMQEVNSLF
jgi:hypothetical protein